MAAESVSELRTFVTETRSELLTYMEEAARMAKLVIDSQLFDLDNMGVEDGYNVSCGNKSCNRYNMTIFSLSSESDRTI